MEFEVNFSTKREANNPAGCVISIPYRTLGLLDLDALKIVFPPPILVDAESVKKFSDHLRQTHHTLRLSEGEARMTGHFDRTNMVNVVVPSGYLNKFFAEAPRRYDDEDSDEPLLVGIGLDFQRASFMEEWERLGFALEIAENAPDLPENFL